MAAGFSRRTALRLALGTLAAHEGAVIAGTKVG